VITASTGNWLHQEKAETLKPAIDDQPIAAQFFKHFIQDTIVERLNQLTVGVIAVRLGDIGSALEVVRMTSGIFRHFAPNLI